MSDLKDATYYLDHPDEATPEVLAALTGETIPEPEKTAAAEPHHAQEDDAVIQAKDGKHTIPFSELEKSREEAKAAKDEADALRQRITELEQERQSIEAARDEKAAAGEDTSEEDALLAAFDEDYPSIAKTQDIKIRRELSSRDKTIAELRSEIDALKNMVTPLQASSQEAAVAGHWAAIRGAHADADQIIESGALDKYAESLPYKQAVEAMRVIKEGTAKEVIDLMSAYKGTQGKPVQKSGNVDDAVPTSLSDFPAGSPASTDEVEALLSKSPVEQMAFAAKYPDKFNQLMARAL